MSISNKLVYRVFGLNKPINDVICFVWFVCLGFLSSQNFKKKKIISLCFLYKILLLPKQIVNSGLFPEKKRYTSSEINDNKLTFALAIFCFVLFI